MDFLLDETLCASFKKREKHLWMSVSFVGVLLFALKPATLLKVVLIPGHFSRFLNYNKESHEL